MVVHTWSGLTKTPGDGQEMGYDWMTPRCNIFGSIGRLDGKWMGWPPSKTVNCRCSGIGSPLCWVEYP